MQEAAGGTAPTLLEGVTEGDGAHSHTVHNDRELLIYFNHYRGSVY